MDYESNEAWHLIEADEALTILQSDRLNGLSEAMIAHRQAKHGPNLLSPPKGHGPIFRFVIQFHAPLVYILLAAGTTTLFLKEYVDAGVIFGVVLVNAIVGFIQESRALDAINALSRSIPSFATVLRAGRIQRIAASELVPGDVVQLKAGDKIPADLRLIRASELHVDESALTGESIPVGKHAAALNGQVILADRKNMVYSSALVTRGTGSGVVVGIGDGTEIGRIASLVASAKTLDTPLTRRIKEFSHILVLIILGLAGLTFLVGVLRGQEAVDMFLASVALAVGAIPEGLPAAVTIILAIGVNRMAARKAIIRSLPSVETLGSTSVICCDKTGTLTQNQMTVLEILTADKRYKVSGSGFDPHGEITPDGGNTSDAAEDDDTLQQILLAGLLCNDSSLVEKDGIWHAEGDPTESALISTARKGGMRQTDVIPKMPRISEVPFDSEYKYMATLHDRGPDQPPIAMVKGSAESLLNGNILEYRGGGNSSAGDREKILKRVEELTSRGLRVLALARKAMPHGTKDLNHEHVSDGLEILGLQGMIDPPRPEVIEAIKACHSAGISVKMITGDHATTAKAIAQQLGIVGEGASAITGQQLREMDGKHLEKAVNETNVFARVTPEHKLKLVEALQAQGHVVAMTGDGVNDAPALRRADIGVAMGASGTEVAREAADMVLTDDNFATIVAAVEEGRTVFNNLLKFIVWTIPTNGGEGFVICLAILLGVALPILPVQILWINMSTALCLGMMLAFEPGEADVMEKPPREAGKPIFTKPLIMRSLLVSSMQCAAAFGLYQYELGLGVSDEIARTVAATVFVIVETAYLFNCRSLTRSFFKLNPWSNRWIWIGAGLMLLLQLGFVYLPFMNDLFQTAPLSWNAWGRILAAGLVVFLIVEIEKVITQRRTPDLW